MERNEIITALERIHNGSFFSVKYRTELPVKAENKKKGISITKYSKATVRTGVKYSNIAEVIAERKTKETTETKTRANNNEVLINNKAVHNTNNGKDYICLATVNNTKIKSLYLIVIEGKEIIADKLNDEYKALLIDSANTVKKATPYKRIAFDNIISIGSSTPISYEDIING